LYFISIEKQLIIPGVNFGFGRFLFFALVVAAVYSLKLIILKSAGFLFGVDREMVSYIFNVFLINNVSGIVLLPIIALLAFGGWLSGPWLITVALTLLLIAFIYRLFRAITIGMGSPFFSPFYLFLYLCALEIAPLAVLLKFVKEL
jgi:hypothetical protein